MAGLMWGVSVLPATTGHATTLEKTACCLFSYLKVGIAVNFGLPVLLWLHFNTFELTCVWNGTSWPTPVAFRQTFHLAQVVFWNVWNKQEWKQCAIFYLSLTKLLQLLSPLRRDTCTWCVAEPWRLTWGVECHDLQYTSIIYGLYIHTMNSQLKARSDDHEYDMTVHTLTQLMCILKDVLRASLESRHSPSCISNSL